MSVVDFTPTVTPAAGTGLLPKRVDLVIYRGDEYKYPFNFKDSGGGLILFSGLTWTCEIKATGNTEAVAVATPTVIVNQAVSQGGAEAGNVVIHVTSAISQGLAAGDYMYELSAANVSNAVRTYLGGTITVHEDIITNV